MRYDTRPRTQFLATQPYHTLLIDYQWFVMRAARHPSNANQPSHEPVGVDLVFDVVMDFLKHCVCLFWACEPP